MNIIGYKAKRVAPSASEKPRVGPGLLRAGYYHDWVDWTILIQDLTRERTGASYPLRLGSRRPATTAQTPDSPRSGPIRPRLGSLNEA